MPKALRFLLVEDNPEICGLLQQILRSKWPDCHTDVTGRRTQAWNLLNLEPDYDLVIVDGQLEDGHGSDLVELFARERATTRTGGKVHRLPQPRFLGISGDASSLVKHENAGCHGTLLKPFTAEQLLAAVQRILYPESFADVAAHPNLDRAVAAG